MPFGDQENAVRDLASRLLKNNCPFFPALIIPKKCLSKEHVLWGPSCLPFTPAFGLLEGACLPLVQMVLVGGVRNGNHSLRLIFFTYPCMFLHLLENSLLILGTPAISTVTLVFKKRQTMRGVNTLKEVNNSPPKSSVSPGLSSFLVPAFCSGAHCCYHASSVRELHPLGSIGI